MKVLIVGSGGREHALLWKLKHDQPTARFYAAPGNGGTESTAETVRLKPEQIEALADFASSKEIDLTVVGPEAPLALGLVDLFQERQLPIFGPSGGAAQIESSKAFAKNLMEKAGIPTAGHRTFESFDAAERHIRCHGAPLVVKASGLAAGKGSIVCQTEEEAIDAARWMLVDGRFGEAGDIVVVEDHLCGEELSIMVLSDGTSAHPLLPSQDHKPIGEGDTGPNTGGMGAYAPVSIADNRLVGHVMDRIVMPALAELSKTDRPYRGVLYCGLMIVDGEPFVIEYNCRFGDPEAQAVLPLMASSLLEPIERLARGASIKNLAFDWREQAAVCTVLASEGYPGSYEQGIPIDIPETLAEDDNVILLHAGTRRTPDGQLVSNGGRVLGVVGLGPSVTAAAEKSRSAAGAVHFGGGYFRRDIGHREIERESTW